MMKKMAPTKTINKIGWLNKFLSPWKIVGGAKEKIMSLFKKNITNDYSKPKLIINVYGGGKKPRKLKMQKNSEDNIIKNIRNIFRLEKENTGIKDRVIRDIKKLFEKK